MEGENGGGTLVEVEATDEWTNAEGWGFWEEWNEGFREKGCVYEILAFLEK